MRPEITCQATIELKYEEKILKNKIDPERCNDEVICPRTVQINMDYVSKWILLDEVKYIFRTVNG